jgi:hypothetical protein
MATLRNVRCFSTIAIAGMTALLSTAAMAAVQSSCPAPCLRPPKTAIFVRESPGLLDQFGDINPLQGTLLRGAANTVLRVDASIVVKSDAGVPGVYVAPRVNGYLSVPAGLGGVSVPCTTPDPVFCSATGTFWFDIDALEAAHPGMFVGQPLNIELNGGNSAAAGGGLQTEATLSAQVVKKK